MSDDFNQMLAKMRLDFIGETPGRCAQLEDAVMDLERGVPGAFEELFRQVHSLKGTGGTFGLEMMILICHDFETFITKARDHFGTIEANFSLSYIDLLRSSAGCEGIHVISNDDIRFQLARLHEACMPKRGNVLLIEPSATARAILKAQFAKMPVDLKIFDQGLYALSTLETETYDVFVCSGEMSDISAFDLLSVLRESDGPNRQIPVILVSSNPFPDHARLGVRAVVRRDPRMTVNLETYIGKLLGWKSR
jgi:CheY-like chemotaxis protein